MKSNRTFFRATLRATGEVRDFETIEHVKTWAIACSNTYMQDLSVSVVEVIETSPCILFANRRTGEVKEITA